ncbi:MAG: serine protease SohB, partial [Paraglaciecola sp.]
MEFLYEYGLFIAKTVTLAIAILIVVGGVISLASRNKRPKGNLEIDSISDRLADVKERANHLISSKEELKTQQKEQKKADKAAKKVAKSKVSQDSK